MESFTNLFGFRTAHLSKRNFSCMQPFVKKSKWPLQSAEQSRRAIAPLWSALASVQRATSYQMRRTNSLMTRARTI